MSNQKYRKKVHFFLRSIEEPEAVVVYIYIFVNSRFFCIISSAKLAVQEEGPVFLASKPLAYWYGLRFHPSGSWVQLPPSGPDSVYVTAVLATPPPAQAGALASGYKLGPLDPIRGPKSIYSKIYIKMNFYLFNKRLAPKDLPYCRLSNKKKEAI